MQSAGCARPEEAYADATGLAELRGQALSTLVVATLVFATGLVALGVVDPGTRRPELWLVVACVAAAGIAAQELRGISLALASIALAAGLALGLRVAIWLYPDGQLVYLFAVVVMVGAVLLGVRAGFAAALLVSILVLVEQRDSPALVWGGAAGTVLMLTWASAVLCWLATRPTQTALDWCWQSYVQALQRTEELRDRQGELGRLSKSLTEACVRLEQMNVELERARQVAEEARRLKGEFAAAISHELRTPLNLIIGFSEMMVTARHTYLGEVLPESYRGDVEAIYRSACHISNLIDDVLDLSRIEAHRMALQRERAALGPVVEEAVATIRSLVAEVGLKLTVDVPPELPSLYVDRTRVKQILINLLNNAVRSTEHGGIAVTARQREGEVVISVSDTGVGIAPEDLPHLFDEYSQIGGANRRGRSGLGLAVSRQFAELHGGAMWAESRPGEGSTFHLSLPMHDHVVVSPFESTPDVLPLDGARDHAPTVAVLGEDAEAAKLFRRYLDGYHVVYGRGPRPFPPQENGATPQAVVLTDDDSVEQWKAVQPDQPPARQVPVLICSLSTARLRAGELGVTDYLVKPITSDQLRAALGRIDSGRGARTLLVVEDDAEMARLLAKMVRSFSRRYRVRCASDGAEGLAMAREQRPDAVLLDLLMPGVDGYQVLQEMRADPGLRDVPVVIITARERHEEPVVAAALSISKLGGLTVAELMRCAKGALDCLVGAAPRDTDPARPGAPVA